MKLRPITSAVLFALSVAAATHAYADGEIRHSYIVQLADKPVATYDGTVSGLQATKPAAGQRLNVDASSVQNYIAYLETNARAAAQSEQEKEDELLKITAQKAVDVAKAKGAKQVEKELQKFPPSIMNAAKEAVDFKGNVTGRKVEELEPLLLECKIRELRARTQ